MDSLDLIANLIGATLPLLLLLLWFKGIPWGSLFSPPTRFLKTVFVGVAFVIMASLVLELIARMGIKSLEPIIPFTTALMMIPFVGSLWLNAIYLLTVNPSQKQ